MSQQPPMNYGQQAAGSAGSVPPDVAASAPMLQQQPPAAPPGPEALQQMLVQNQHRQAQLAHQNLPVAPSSSSAAAAAPGVQAPAPAAVLSSAPAAAADPLKRLPIRAYLDQTVVPILLDGAFVCRFALRGLRRWPVCRVHTGPLSDDAPLRSTLCCVAIVCFIHSTFLVLLLLNCVILLLSILFVSLRDVGVGP
jgi:hypothetical protein